MPPRPDQAPIARARSLGRKLASIRARLPGVSRAPPIPCSSRAAISSSALVAVAVVEELAGGVGVDQDGIERLQREGLLFVDPHPPAALQQQVELLLAHVPVPGRGLPRL